MSINFNSKQFVQLLGVLTFCGIVSQPLFCQQVQMALSSASAVPGASVTLSVALTDLNGALPSSIQWSMNYSPTDVTAVTVAADTATPAAGKNISCASSTGTTTCAIWGLNSTSIVDGVVASATFQIANGISSVSVPIQLVGTVATAGDSSSLASVGAGGSILITQPDSLSISGTISNGQGATVSVSGAASAATSVDAAGKYSIGGLPRGTYTVTPNLAGSSPTPLTRTVTLDAASLAGVDFAYPAGSPTDVITPDATVWGDQGTPSSVVTSAGFSTVYNNELLLAFIATDYSSGSNTTVTSVSGAGLIWELVTRTNAQNGTAEIWRAFAPAPLANVMVTANLSQSVLSSLTVMTFSGVDPSGIYGSGAIGAVGSASPASGAPSSFLTTTRDYSLVLGVGNDWDNAISRTPGAGQTVVHEYLAPTGDTYWVQRQDASTQFAGTSVAISDLGPVIDRYNLSVVEVLPLPSMPPQTWSVSGMVTPAINGNGATVRLSGPSSATTTVDASGHFSFTNLANRSYTVTASKPGFSFNPASLTAKVSGANVGGLNFTATSTATWSISGIISPAGAGSGATVQLSGGSSATTVADSSGHFSFANVADGSYTVMPRKTGFVFGPASLAAKVNGANLIGLKFTATSTAAWSISGTISPAGSGSGATVQLGGGSSATTVADSAGHFSFANLADGSYTVTPRKAGLIFGPTSLAANVNGANVSGLNFTATSTAAWSISGTISPAGSSSGAAVQLSGGLSASTTPDSAGHFSFSDLANGSYTVTPRKTGFIFSPTSLAANVNGANISGLNFTAQPVTGSGPILRDATVSRDQGTPSHSVTSPVFQTNRPNELLLAFIATDYISGPNTTVSNVQGGGLNWVRVARTNSQSGDTEIWRAFSPSALSGVSVKASLSQSVVSSLTVMSFSGVDVSGLYGAGAIGAVSSGSAESGAPSAKLVTTRNNSLVLGCGNDFDNAIARVPGPGQSLVHQDFAATGDTYWVQMLNDPVSPSGTTVVLNDSAPSSDRYNLTIVEVLPFR